MSVTTTAEVRLSDYDVTVPVDPEQFLKLVPGFLIEAEMKRRQEVLAAATAVGHTLEATATATRAEFPPGSTIPVEGEVDISTTTEVEVESDDDDDSEPPLDCSIDDVDDMAEAFLNRDTTLFEMRFAKMAPGHLADRMSTRLRR